MPGFSLAAGKVDEVTVGKAVGKDVAGGVTGVRMPPGHGIAGKAKGSL